MSEAYLMWLKGTLDVSGLSSEYLLKNLLSLQEEIVESRNDKMTSSSSSLWYRPRFDGKVNFEDFFIRTLFLDREIGEEKKRGENR